MGPVSNVLNPLFMQWAFWERCKGGHCDRSFPGLTYTGSWEHSSVLGSACYAYLNWWQAISGCHAIPFHIILPPPLSLYHSGSLLLFPTHNFLSFCFSHSLFCSPPSPSSTTSLSLSLPFLPGWFIGSGLAGLNSYLHYGNLVMPNASGDAG